MAENVENLILEHLRAVRSDIAALREDTREIKTRLIRIEAARPACAGTRPATPRPSRISRPSSTGCARRSTASAAGWNH
jgi:hypothetical protein